MTAIRLPLVIRLLAAPLAAIVTLAGIWIAGGLITNDFEVSMWLMLAWMVLTAVAALAIAARSRALRWPVLAGYVVAAAVAGAYLGSAVLFDDIVDEQVAIAAPPSAGEGTRDGPVNVLLRAGRFEAVRHGASGTARVIRLAGDGRVLTLTDFAIANGPDLRLYLVAGPSTTESEVDDVIDLGALKGNKGDQQYGIPARTDLSRHATVVVWCRAFSVLFARAPLTVAQ